MEQLVERGDDVNVVHSSSSCRGTALHFAAKWGRTSVCELLLKNGANICATDENGDQPLHCAARNDEAAVCELLVARRADVAAVNKKGQTPLSLAACSRWRWWRWRPPDPESTATCRLLLTNEIVNVADCDGNYPLHMACRSNNIATVQLLMDHGADTNAVNKHGQTPLHTGAGGKEDWPDLCKLLVKHGTKINAVDEYGNQPLHLACHQGYKETVKFLVSQGADANAVNKHGQTPLHTAAGGKEDWPDLCKRLVKHGTKIDAVDEDGNQPLHLACHQCYTETVRFMVSNGADTNAVNTHGQTPLHTAGGGKNDCPRLCKLLVQHGTKIDAVDEDGNQPLHLACHQCYTKTVRLMVSNGADTNAVNKHRQTPLHAAAGGKKDCPDLCKLLVKHDAKVDEDGNQPLHLACHQCYTETVRFMVSNEADANAVNTHGQTPLHTAAGGKNDCPKLCEVLLKHDAKIDAVDGDGNQPLHLACQQNHDETGNLFVSYDADVSAVNSNGHSPLHLLSTSVRHFYGGINSEEESVLHIAARHGMATSVQLLVCCGADVNTVNTHGQTPLHTAAGGKNDCPKLCEVLLKHDAKIDAVDKDGNQPLHVACMRAFAEIVKVMVSHEADTNAVNKRGQTPLHTATGGEEDCPELCKILLKHDAKTDEEDEDGSQPLHLVCEAGQTMTVKALLGCNANVSAKNNYDQTCLHKAASSQRDCPDLCLLLIEKGAEVNAVDGGGDTPLQVALQKGNIKTSEVLLANSADCKALNRCGETVLHSLCKGGINRHELCEDLISHGANPHQADREGNLPLHVALNNKLSKVFCLLCKQLGSTTLDDLPKMNIPSKDINCCLWFAANVCDADSCQKLLDLGADPNLLYRINQLPNLNLHSSARVYPLHIAVYNNSSGLCCLLLDHGATVNVSMLTDKSTSALAQAQPLHLAVKLGYIDVCHVLLERSADVNAKMKKRKSPLYLAIVGNREDIVQLLLTYGAIAHTVKIGGVPALERSAIRGSRSVSSLLHDSGERHYPMFLAQLTLFSL